MTPQQKKILVVDDAVDGATSIALLLRAMGHLVALAHDGFAALEEARRLRPDVVLLDLGLPRMDGFEVARRLRAELGRQMLIVAVTGYVQEEDRQKAIEAGFDHYAPKPIPPGFLNSLLGARSG